VSLLGYQGSVQGKSSAFGYSEPQKRNCTCGGGCAFSFVGSNLTNLKFGTQVERALYLWETGALTIEMLGSGSKAPKIAKTLNKATGKESTHERSFSEANYGDTTRYYSVQVDALRLSSMEFIVTEANKRYHDMNRKAMKSMTTIQVDVDLSNSRPALVDLSD
jgi:hypothetical protein